MLDKPQGGMLAGILAAVAASSSQAQQLPPNITTAVLAEMDKQPVRFAPVRVTNFKNLAPSVEQKASPEELAIVHAWATEQLVNSPRFITLVHGIMNTQGNGKEPSSFLLDKALEPVVAQLRAKAIGSVEKVEVIFSKRNGLGVVLINTYSPGADAQAKKKQFTFTI